MQRPKGVHQNNGHRTWYERDGVGNTTSGYVSASTPYFDFLRQAKHPHLLSLTGVCFRNNEGKLYSVQVLTSVVCFISPVPGNGTLASALANDDVLIEQAHVKLWSLQICLGMGYLHSLGLMHQNLTSEALILDKNWSIKSEFHRANY